MEIPPEDGDLYDIGVAFQSTPDNEVYKQNFDFSWFFEITNSVNQDLEGLEPKLSKEVPLSVSALYGQSGYCDSAWRIVPAGRKKKGSTEPWTIVFPAEALIPQPVSE